MRKKRHARCKRKPLTPLGPQKGAKLWRKSVLQAVLQAPIKQCLPSARHHHHQKKYKSKSLLADKRRATPRNTPTFAMNHAKTLCSPPTAIKTRSTRSGMGEKARPSGCFSVHGHSSQLKTSEELWGIGLGVKWHTLTGRGFGSQRSAAS